MNTNGNDGNDRKKRPVWSTTTGDPAFDPAGVVEVNGYCFVAAGEVERLRVEVAAWRQQAINEGWSHTLADAYGREEYARGRIFDLDALIAKRIANGLFADAALAGGAK